MAFRYMGEVPRRLIESVAIEESEPEREEYELSYTYYAIGAKGARQLYVDDQPVGDPDLAVTMCNPADVAGNMVAVFLDGTRHEILGLIIKHTKDMYLT